MKFLWQRRMPPLESRMRDAFGPSPTGETESSLPPKLPQELSPEQMAGLALHRVSGLRELPAARLEAIGRRGFARAAPRPSMVALRWSLTTLATVLALNLAVAAALGGIDHFGPRVSELLAADHARLVAEAAEAAAKAKAAGKVELPKPEDGLAKASRLLWVDHDPQKALAALVNYVQQGPKAPAENAILANESGLKNDTEIVRAEQLRDTNRCPEAMHGFDKVLASNPESLDVRERATFGRAQCLSLTDQSAARSELHKYLSTFPKGKFAAEARRALGE